MFRTCLALACVTVLAGADLTVSTTHGGGITVSRGALTLLSLAPVAWGPRWSYAGWSGEWSGGGAQGQAILTSRLGASGVALRLECSVVRVDARTVRLEFALLPQGDAEITLVALGITAAPPLHGEVALHDAGGVRPVAVPFARGAVGAAVDRLDFADVGVSFADGVTIVGDGQARVVLAEGQVAAAQPRRMTLTLHGATAITLWATPDDVPAPPDADRWFAWQPEHAHDDAGALGMADWNAPITDRVRRDDDMLRLAGERYRGWGLNLCFAHCAPDRATADRRAAFYAKYGVNTVRLHKYADGPGWAGIQSATSAAALDPEGLDRMDYFVYALKQRGIRVKLSPSFGVKLGPDDRARVPHLEEYGSLQGQQPRVQTRHGAVYLDPGVAEVQITQSLALLAHRNPYTGLTYAEDPAIVAFELFNEDSALFFGTLTRLQQVPTLRRLAGARFFAWLHARYGDETRLRAAWGEGVIGSFAHEGLTDEAWADGRLLPIGNPWFFDPDQLAGSQAHRRARLHDTMHFLYDLQNEFYDRYTAALRAAGYDGEILASNWHAGRDFSHYYNLHSDWRIGLIDRHNYHEDNARSLLDHPGSSLLGSGLQQVADRPFMLSEWIHVYPCEYGGEGLAVLGAYGLGLQGWDVSYLFQNRDDGRTSATLGGDRWDVVAPQLWALFPAVARQVRRGDVAQSDLLAVRSVHVPSLHEGRLGFTDRAQQQGDIQEMDSQAVPAATLAVARAVVRFTETFTPTSTFDLTPHRQGDTLVSSTGELRWTAPGGHHQGYFSIDTAGTAALVGFARDQRADLTAATITNRSGYAAIYLSAAGPREHLTNARRILLTTVARARNTDMVYAHATLLRRGQAPILMEPVVADIQLKREGTPTVHVLDHDGRRTGTTVPVVAGAFTVDSGATRAVWYEIAYDE